MRIYGPALIRDLPNAAPIKHSIEKSEWHSAPRPGWLRYPKATAPPTLRSRGRRS